MNSYIYHMQAEFEFFCCSAVFRLYRDAINLTMQLGIQMLIVTAVMQMNSRQTQYDTHCTQHQGFCCLQILPYIF